MHILILRFGAYFFFNVNYQQFGHFSNFVRQLSLILSLFSILRANVESLAIPDTGVIVGDDFVKTTKREPVVTCDYGQSLFLVDKKPLIFIFYSNTALI